MTARLGVAATFAMGIIFAAAAGAVAANLTDGVRDVTVIQDASGNGRILFRAGNVLSGLTEAAVSKALLTVSMSGEASARTLPLRVHPVTTESWTAGSVDWTAGWSRAGGDFDDEVFAAEVNLARGGAAVVFDVTAILKEVIEAGMTADGFLLTVDPATGIGIPSADLGRFGTLSGATLEVTYRPLPAGLLARERDR
ncbi:MAG TPA: hypothetical protein VKU85_07710 [bacterium]|nr:hypothetical protein [bacterium]